MDPKNNLEAITQDIIVQTVDLPEGGDGGRNLKISDIDNTSLEKNDTEVITNVNNMPDEQSLQTEINELGTNIISLDKRHAQIEKEPSNSPIMSSLDPPLIKDEDCESNIIISPEQCLDGKLNNDNDMKLFLDDESCSDMQDEEIQLRWDDDDINLDCEDAESLLEEKKSICKGNDTSVEHMDLDKVHEIATSDTNTNQDDKNVMLNFDKNVSQHDLQNSMCEKIFTQQNDKHIQLENEQCLSLNKCKEIAINDESLIASTKYESVQTPAQVDDGKNVIQHKCEDIVTQQEYNRIVIHQECKKSLSEHRSDQIGSQLGYEKEITQPERKQTVFQPEYQEPVTHHVDDKMDQLIQRKTNIEHESEHITSEEEAKNSKQHKCEKMISHIDSEKNITLHEHKETAAIETKKYITQVDNVKNVNQNQHEDIVPLMDNEESVTQNQSEKNASVVDQEKYLTLSVHKEIAATVENEEVITQNEMKTKVAHVHYDKTATEHKHEETVTLIDNEESVTQHQSEENAPVFDKEKYTTHSDHEEFTAPVDNRKKNIIYDNGDIAPQVDSEKNVIQNEHKIIAASVDSMKTEIKHDNKDISPQIDNEKCITQSQHEEIIAPVDNEENKTQNETKTNVTHVDYDKTTTEHVHKETVTLIDNVESVIQHQCEENATVVDKEKYIAQSEHEKITALADNRKEEIIPDNRDIAPQVDNERYVTQSVCQNEKIAAPVDNDKIATEYEHEETVTLIDNEKSVTQHQSEKNATVVDIEKNITQCEHKEIAAPVDKRKKEIKLGNEDIAPQVDNEKTAILSECDEIAIQHGLKKPDMMLEIPSQELIDFMDDDEPDLLDTLEMSSDEAALEISNDNNCDVDMVVGNDAITAINLDVQMENVETSIECQRETPKDYEKNQKTIKTTGKGQSEVCSETISLLVLKESTHKEKEQNVSVGDPQPSTSRACMITEMRRDSDEVGEVSDSLGLLAESTRVLEDDEEQDDEDDADDDDDYDQYEESSNQMGAEFSEDSNAVNSEIDTGKVTQMGNVNVDKCKAKDQIEMVYIEQENESCEFQISDIKTEIDDHNDIGKHTQQMDHSEILIAEDGEQETEKILMSTDDNIGNIKDTDIINISPVDSRQENETVIESALPLPNDALESNLNKEDEVVLLESSSDEDLLGDADNFSHEIEIPLPSIDVPDLNLQQQAVEKNSVGLDEASEKDDPEKSGKLILDLNQMLKSVRGLEVFSVDSDDDDMLSKNDEDKRFGDSELREVIKCVNISCRSSRDEQYYEADAAVLKYYEADRGKNAAVCESCAEEVFKRNKELIEGIKNNTPLLELDTGKQIVEISDSDSEDEEESAEENSEKIGEAGAKLLEDQLAEMFNTTWQKYNLDSRLGEAQSVIKQDLCRLEKESQKITKMLHECQSATDKLRNELYATFEQERKTLPPIVIFDTDCNVFCEYEEFTQEKTSKTEKAAKRKAAFNDMPAKKPAIVTAQNTEHTKHVQETKPEPLSPRKTVDDDNVDVSVVKLSVESAPADLPQPGEVVKPQLRTGMTVYAMRNNFGIWLKAKIIEIQNKNTSTSLFTMCRLKLEHKVMRNAFITLPARCIAFEDPPDVRLTIGTRIIATSDKNESFYSGVVAEVPNPVNNYRYLVFFDDGHAKYARHGNTRLVCECSPLVWEEVHPNSRDFVRQYLLSYPERPMVRLHPNQSVKAEWNGKWWHSRVIEVDASLALILLAGDRMEWIYRGSTRLGPLYLEFQAAERQRSRPMPRSGPQHRSNMPYVEYTRSDDPPPSKQQQNEEIRRQRAVAKKSTVSSSLPPAAPPSNAANLDNVTSRVVYYTPKNAIRPYKMVPHQCGPKCKRTDVLALKDLRTYNPLAKPLLSAWERQIVRFKGHKEVMYRAPCGRRLRNMAELHRYLRAVKSDMPVDLFDFGPSTHCLAEFVLNKCIVGKKDLSHGKENVPVPCVNYYDDSLPEFCSYNTERTPTAGVPLNLDPEFLCGCDCEDDCKDKKKCACWKMTLEGARTIGLDGEVGYVYRRLPDPLPSGIYECNSRCKCKNTCLNRVAQHPLQLKLQVFKTLNRGWGIRALNDVPKGAFLCVYAGNLLTDATANLDGLNEGDEYLAELDYIEVVEQMKEGYEEDIPGSLKESARQKKSSEEFTEDEESSSEEEDLKYSKDERDDDFRPGYVDVGPTEFNKLLRTREKREKEKSNNPNEEDGIEKQDEKEEEKREEKLEVKREEIQPEKEGEKDNVDDVFITISDDEEVREPSRFTAQAGMNSKHLVSKYRSVRSYFGKDEACYIMDAKVQGNIGRYLNHSCCPNVFVQNVFVDTHDPRFPWVAFFALSHIRAGTELTWNYNYDVGSVPGKILYCYCGAANCRGRLL